MEGGQLRPSQGYRWVGLDPRITPGPADLGKNRIRIRKSGKNRKICFPPVLPYCGRTRAPIDMVGVSTDRAWPKDHAGAIENPEIRIRTELEPENRFSRFALLWLNQGTYRHLQGTCGLGLTQGFQRYQKIRISVTGFARKYGKWKKTEKSKNCVWHVKSKLIAHWFMKAH